MIKSKKYTKRGVLHLGAIRKQLQKKKIVRTPEAEFGLYQTGARRRFLLWDLTFERFMTFWQKPCSYCGEPIETIGLDRMDSEEGYNVDNVISCCPRCNRMKSLMNRDEFISQCRKIMLNYE